MRRLTQLAREARYIASSPLSAMQLKVIALFIGWLIQMLTGSYGNGNVARPICNTQYVKSASDS